MPDPITRNQAGLYAIPQFAPEGWHNYMNANWDTLAGIAGIGDLAVQPRDYDAAIQSNSLYVKVYAGNYAKADGTIGAYPGVAGFLLAANATSCLWLTDAGVLTAGAAFPTTAHVRLASVSTDATKVTGITDERIYASVQGTGLGSPTFRVDPAAGTVAFFAAAGATQAAAVVALADNSTGAAGNTIPAVDAAYTPATLNNIHASLTAKINGLIAALKRHGLMAQ
jgi:hypothetical protein